MLSSVDDVKVILGIPESDTTQDAILLVHLTAADAGVKMYTKRDLEQAVYSQFYSTRGEEKLALKQRPVWQYSLAATLTSGLSTITVATGADSLVAGMPAVLEDYLPVGTTVVSVAGTTVTLSDAAEQSGTVTVQFGVAVWLDTNAAFGQRAGAFGDGTHLWPGSGYVLDRDNSESSKSGLLIRLGGATVGDWWGTGWGWWSGYGRRGTLTARLPPCWPCSAGCVKVVFAAGYPASAIPADLAMAVNELACWLYRYAAQGGILVTSESYRNYSYALGKLQNEPELMSARQLLSRYRETSL